MSGPSRGTRLLIALGGLLAFAGLPLGLFGSASLARRAAVEAGGTEGDALVWVGVGAAVSAVGAGLAGAGLYRLWRSGRLIRPNEHR